MTTIYVVKHFKTPECLTPDSTMTFKTLNHTLQYAAKFNEKFEGRKSEYAVEVMIVCSGGRIDMEAIENTKIEDEKQKMFALKSIQKALQQTKCEVCKKLI